MKRWYQTWLMFTMLCLMGMMCMTEAQAKHRETRADGNPSGQWTITPEGQTLLRPFASAPFPHPSRAKGHVYNDTTFDAAGHYNDSTVGIFIPADYHPSDTLDYVGPFSWLVQPCRPGSGSVRVAAADGAQQA